MDLSIIIPHYQTRDLTGNCIASIYKYTKNVSFETIVVDNGSDDNSSLYLKGKYPQIKLVKSKENKGFGYACNLGAQTARGKYLCILNSDILFVSNWIYQLLTNFKSSKKIGIVAPRLSYPDGNLQKSVGSFPRFTNLLAWTLFIDDLPFISRQINAYHIVDKNFYQQKQEVDWIQAACWLVSAKVYQLIGGFDESFFMYGEDVDFAYRAFKAGYKSIYDPREKVIHLAKGAAQASSIIGEYKGLYQYFQKHFTPFYTRWLVPLIWFNAFIRWLLFGILANNNVKRKTYRLAMAAITKL